MTNHSPKLEATSLLLRIPAVMPDAWLVRRDVRRGVP